MGGHMFITSGELKEFTCSQCDKKDLTEGFTCEGNSKLVLCQKCQDGWNMERKCLKHFDKWGEHRHIKWTRGTETAFGYTTKEEENEEN